MAQATRNSDRKKWEPTTVTGFWICVASAVIAIAAVGGLFGLVCFAWAAQ